MHIGPVARLVPATRLATRLATLLTFAWACVDVPEAVLKPRVGAVQLVQGNNQVTQVGSDAVSPRLRVLRPDSSPMAGLEVRYTVSGQAGSSVLPSRVRTDSTGVAEPIIWVVRTSPGQDTLIATVVGVGAYRFIATVTPPCTGATPIAVGDSIAGAVSAVGCLTGGGRRAVAYTLNGPIGTNPYSVVMRMNGAGYRGRVDIQRNGAPVATTQFDTVSGNTATLAAFLPGPALTVLAQAETPGATGAFGLQIAGPVTISGCSRNIFMSRGAQSTQNIDATACAFVDVSGYTYYGHAYRVRLAGGERVVARMASGALSCFILVFDQTGTTLQSQDGVGTVNAVALDFRAPTSGYYVFVALSTASPRAIGGPYTFSVDP